MSAEKDEDLSNIDAVRRWQINEQIETADMLDALGASEAEIEAVAPLGALYRPNKAGQQELQNSLLIWAASLGASKDGGELVRSINWSRMLRTELCALATRYAQDSGEQSYVSLGRQAVVFFPPNHSRHGNFQQRSYTVIKSTPEWASRLSKSHAQRANALPEPYNSSACELDSCTSSDALLMNVMCYPGVVAGQIAELLGVRSDARPRFGVPGAVPLENGKTDSTELDMLIDDTIVEAKLTEASFTNKAKSVVERYAALDEVFDESALPRAATKTDGEEDIQSYQLIRNVLATAHRPNSQFRVLLDSRRPDLLREWWALHGAIRSAELRARCGFVTWQELAAASPKPLRDFLRAKYGL
jgi:hypothetical protein